MFKQLPVWEDQPWFVAPAHSCDVNIPAKVSVEVRRRRHRGRVGEEAQSSSVLASFGRAVTGGVEILVEYGKIALAF